MGEVAGDKATESWASLTGTGWLSIQMQIGAVSVLR